MIAEIQCLPEPVGVPGQDYRNVDAAIAVIAASGLDHEVGALGTTLQGQPDQVWDVLRRAHEATLQAGARTVVSVIKVVSAIDPDAPGMADLVAAHR